MYKTGEPVTDVTWAVLLLQMDSSGHAGEGFRISLEGPALQADIWTRDIFESSDLGWFRLLYEIAQEKVELRPTPSLPLGETWSPY